MSSPVGCTGVYFQIKPNIKISRDLAEYYRNKAGACLGIYLISIMEVF